MSVHHDLKDTTRPSPDRVLVELCEDRKKIEATPVQDFVSLFVV